MDELLLKLRKIKNIKEANIEIPFDNDVYLLVGPNGCGKSTIMNALALLVSPKHIGVFKKYDYHEDSVIEISYKSYSRIWSYKNRSFGISNQNDDDHNFNGLYEGSLFYGTRFSDSRLVDRSIAKGYITEKELANADDYVKEQMSYILHGDKVHYSSLKRVRNKEVAKKLRLRNRPYFIEPEAGVYISQYRMSSGECLLVSLLHFVYNAIVRKSLPIDKPIIVLIDEIELALHPIAIKRLLDFLKELTEKYNNLTIYLSSHSPEIIKDIKPRNIIGIECDNNGIIHINRPCYPSYAIRDIYHHDGYDFLLLVEDELSRHIVNEILSKDCQNRLVHVTPVGGWRNVLDLHLDLLKNNVLGTNKNIISILDGDVKDEVIKENKYKNLHKTFLPVSSIEKFLYEKLVRNVDYEFKMRMKNRYFKIESLDEIISQYYNIYNYEKDVDGKKLYSHLGKALEKNSISEETFIKGLCEDILQLYPLNIETFKSKLQKMM